MLAPSTIKDLDSTILHHFSHICLYSLVLSLPPHHQEVDPVDSERAIIVRADGLRNLIVDPLNSLLPILINSPRPSQVIMRVRHHVDDILVETLLRLRLLFSVFLP